MRLLVLNYEYPPLGGGAGNATSQLSRQWGALGHETVVLTTWFSGLPRLVRDGNVEIRRLPAKRKCPDRSNAREMFSYLLRAIPEGFALHRNRPFDRTICFFGLPTGLAGLFLKARCGIPYTVLLRGGDVPGFLAKELRRYHLLSAPLTYLVWKNAERLIANGRGLAALAQRTGNRIRKRIEAVPNGVDTGFWKPSLATKKPFRFLFVGRFVPQKNLAYLVSQFGRLLAQVPLATEVGLELVGDGPERNAVEMLIRGTPLLRNRVRLFGWGTKEELAARYESATCFLNPSLEEGMPNTVLEAMASGLAVIASDVPGNNEVVINGRNGYLFPLAEPDGLLRCMQAALAGDCRKMGEAGRLLTEEVHSWRVSARRILEPEEA